MRGRESVVTAGRYSEQALGLVLLSLHVDIKGFLTFIVAFKADIHYSGFPALTGVTHVENRKETQAVLAAFKETANLV